MSTAQGLEGVIIGSTRLSRVRGEEGRLIYGGYEIEDLAEHASFEEVCHLLWYGRLPGQGALDQLAATLRAEARVDERVLDVARLGAARTHPMAVLRTAISAAGMFDADGEDGSAEADMRRAIRLTAQAATITAAIARFREGRDAIPPRDDLSLAGNFLYMLRGEVPQAIEARTIDIALVLHAEHGMNASTFAARVATGTLTDMHSAVVAAIGTLKGPLHGGANEGVMKMLLRIGDPDRAAEWVRAALARGERIMGFGHRVYRTTDPRAPILKLMAQRLQERAGDSTWLEISDRVQAVMATEMERRGKAVYPNVDFFSASVYYTLGIPLEIFTNIFACARMAGWTAHIMEQKQDNRLIRPRAEYTGPDGLRVEPIEMRG